MKVKEAYLCLECEEVFVGGGRHPCPSCANTKAVPIQYWLYRQRYPQIKYQGSAIPDPYKGGKVR